MWLCGMTLNLVCQHVVCNGTEWLCVCPSCMQSRMVVYVTCLMQWHPGLCMSTRGMQWDQSALCAYLLYALWWY